jgi:acyl-CoA thioester hydrolase
MITSEIQVRVRYSETDQMAYVYYGNYAAYFEVARVECFRQMGFSYKRLEDLGVMMPVLEYKTKYLKPALYDDLLRIVTNVKEKPGVRIKFDYEVFNEQGQLLTIAETTLVFISKETGRPCLPPEEFRTLLEAGFTEDKA